MDSIPYRLKKISKFSNNFSEKSPFWKNRIDEEPQIQPEMTWRIEEEMSEAKSEDEQRRNDTVTEEREDEGERRGYEVYGFSTVKQIRVEAYRNSGIGFDFRHLRPFVLAFGFVRNCVLLFFY